jgi:hypothetical protein
MFSATQMPSDFTPLQRKIEETVERLKATKHPFLRREELKELRRLLGEADRALRKPRAIRKARDYVPPESFPRPPGSLSPRRDGRNSTSKSRSCLSGAARPSQKLLNLLRVARNHGLNNFLHGACQTAGCVMMHTVGPLTIHTNRLREALLSNRDRPSAVPEGRIGLL